MVEAGGNDELRYLIMLALLAVVFWMAAYFRLKEKQV